MGGWGAPTNGGAAGDDAPERRRCMRMPIVVPTVAVTAKAPTTPPMMGAKFELLFDEDEEVGFAFEEGSLKNDDVAPLRVPDAETVGAEAPEAPSMAPGAISGESRSSDVGVSH